MEKRTIGSFIATLRKAKGLTQRQLAEYLNVSDKAISRWERDESAPDLSMIPVLAEIFEVTSDEILRGCRSNPNEQESKHAIKQSEKQLQYLLNKSKTEFQILCVITLLVALCGFIVAMICNAFASAHLGFYVSLIFYTTAAACQSMFLIQTKSNIQYNTITESATIIKELILLTEVVLCVIAALFTATLPLLICVTYVDQGLPKDIWMMYGAIYGTIGLTFALIIITIINRRLGYEKS